MSRSKLFGVLSGAVFVMGALLALPLFLGGSGVCSLKTSAQDNPCLAAEATNSALQIQVLQAQGTSAALQTTITAYESQSVNLVQSTGTGGDVSSSPGLPFEENFSTNQRGWDLTARSEGVARFSRGALMLTGTPGQPLWVPIPDFQVGDNFYIEADVTAPVDFHLYVGFGLGDTATDKFHSFLAGRGWNLNTPCHDNWCVEFLDNTTRIFATRYNESLWTVGQSFAIGLEALDGLYSLYVNGNLTETSQISPYGNNIGLVVTIFDGDRIPEASFDNLVIREFR